VRRVLVSFASMAFPAVALTASSCGGAAPSSLRSGSVDSGFEAEDEDASIVDAAAPEADTAVADTALGGGDALQQDGPVEDALPTPDSFAADAPPPSYSIACGPTTTCTAPAEFCCYAGITSETCETDTTDCSGAADTPITCTSSTQCAQGQVCCGHVVADTTGTTHVSCEATCTGTNDYVFCDPSVASDCPGGEACIASTRLIGFFRCN